MSTPKRLLFFSLVVTLLSASTGWIINDINVDMVSRSAFLDEDNEIEDSATFIEPRVNLIYPGTKWCGAGNIADSFDDLGEEIEADKCCRTHDNCADIIPGGETKYNLTNSAFYTRLSCECDEEFRQCMKAAGTRVAKVIGVIYFNALHTKCYREDYPVTGCTKKGGWLNSKCAEYSYDENGERIYQWFDVKDF